MNSGIQFLGSKLDFVPGMKISLKRNIFFCLFVTTVVVLAVYQYCDANKNRCYPYPLEHPGPVYQITNESFVTLKDLYTSGHVKWIPKDIDESKDKGKAEDVNDFIKFTSDLNAKSKIQEHNMSILPAIPASKFPVDAESEVARYKKQTLQLESANKDQATTINKKERELRRFERVDRLIDDHDDEDDNTIERLRTMDTNRKPYDHKRDNNLNKHDSNVEINLADVRFSPLSKAGFTNIDQSVAPNVDDNNTKFSINRTENLKIPDLSKVGGNDSTVGDSHLGSMTATALHVPTAQTGSTLSRRFDNRDSSSVSTNERFTKVELDKEDALIMKEVLNGTQDNDTGLNTLMRDIIQGDVKKILPNFSEADMTTFNKKMTTKEENSTQAPPEIDNLANIGKSVSPNAATNHGEQTLNISGKENSDQIKNGFNVRSESIKDIIKNSNNNAFINTSNQPEQSSQEISQTAKILQSSGHWIQHGPIKSDLTIQVNDENTHKDHNGQENLLKATSTNDLDVKKVPSSLSKKNLISSGKGNDTVALSIVDSKRNEVVGRKQHEKKTTETKHSSGNEGSELPSSMEKSLTTNKTLNSEANSKQENKSILVEKPYSKIVTPSSKEKHHPSVKTKVKQKNALKSAKTTSSSKLQTNMITANKNPKQTDQNDINVSPSTNSRKQDVAKQKIQIKRDKDKSRTGLGKERLRKFSRKKVSRRLKKVEPSSVSHRPLYYKTTSCKPLNPSVLLYNRIFKTGSTTLETFMQNVSKRQGYKAYQGETEDWYDSGDPTPYPNVIENISKRTKPYKTFTAHFYFRKDLAITGQYTYINQVREPIRRFVSHYYYMRSQNRPKRRIREMLKNGQWNETLEECFAKQHKGCQNNLMTRFFCGTDEFCKTGSDKALHQAMYNMQHYYASIGILEYLNVYVRILKRRLPRYFPKKVWTLTPMKVNDNINYFKNVSPKTIEKIRLANKADIKLYKFAKSLFWKQVRACRLKKRKRYA